MQMHRLWECRQRGSERMAIVGKSFPVTIRFEAWGVSISDLCNMFWMPHMYKMIFDFNINIFVPHSLLSEARVFCLDFLPVRNPQIKKFTITGEYKISTLLLEAGIHGGGIYPCSDFDNKDGLFQAMDFKKWTVIIIILSCKVCVLCLWLQNRCDHFYAPSFNFKRDWVLVS